MVQGKTSNMRARNESQHTYCWLYRCNLEYTCHKWRRHWSTRCSYVVRSPAPDPQAQANLAHGGAAVAPMADAFPVAVQDGVVSRDALKEIIGADPSSLKKIEQIVHPLVKSDRDSFIAASSAEITVLDIPLLFENGTEKSLDAVVCVSISAELQRERVLARGTMTAEQFENILAKQMPIDDKIAKSDYVIETDTLDHALQQVKAVIADIKQRLADA